MLQQGPSVRVTPNRLYHAPKGRPCDGLLTAVDVLYTDSALRAGAVVPRRDKGRGARRVGDAFGCADMIGESEDSGKIWLGMVANKAGA